MREVGIEPGSTCRKETTPVTVRVIVPAAVTLKTFGTVAVAVPFPVSVAVPGVTATDPAPEIQQTYVPIGSESVVCVAGVALFSA
jgi:hypothetical protein